MDGMETERIQGAGKVRIGKEVLDIEFDVPADACSPRELLPDVQRFANRLVDAQIQQVVAHGENISCKAGCGACCRQMVPIGPDEARHLAALVDAMPPERQAIVRERFRAAIERLESSGLSMAGIGPDTDREKYRETVLGYFRLGIACPFLEDESCSIHPDRPLVCREYLVTSDPAHCANLGTGKVQQVAMPVRLWNVFARSAHPRRQLDWTCLIYALEFARNQPEPPPAKTGPEQVERFLDQLRDA